MIPRTKHLIVGIGALALVIASGPLLIAAQGGMTTLGLLPSQSALLIESTDTGFGVVVVEDTTREDTRRSLIEKLKSYTPSLENEGETEQEEIPTNESPVEEFIEMPQSETAELPVASLRCTDGRVSGSEKSSWGPVVMSTAEGARVVTSVALGDNGMPLSVLQLPLMPRVTGGETCLPEGMVGLLLDGSVVKSDEPLVTSAEGLAGYALDGFGIFGSYEDGGVIDGSKLDRCHGHVHSIVWDGTLTSMYHYHVTNDAPYSLGCFRGTPMEVN